MSEICIHCGCPLAGATLARRRHGVCPVCYNNKYYQCYDCGAHFLRVSVFICYGTRFCSAGCANNYRTCTECADLCHVDELTDGQCCDCYNSQYVDCAECGRECPVDEMSEGLCGECSETAENTRRIHIMPAKPNEVGFLTTRPFSVELEIIDSSYNIRYKFRDELWRYVSDGSLSDGGTEYLGGPFAGQQAIDSIKLFDKATIEHRGIDKSCGYHIHMDATQESEATIENFVRWCVHVQDSVSKLVSKDRQRQYKSIKDSEGHGLYCQRLPEFPKTTSLEDFVYTIAGKCRKDKQNKYSQSRYFWLNAHSFYFRSTIEVRIHQGAVAHNTVLCWAELWLKFFEYCKQNEFNPDYSNQITYYFGPMGLRETTAKFYNERVVEFS